MKHSKLLLEPLQKRALYLATTLLWLSGAIWLYLLETDPARPLWMRLHGAAAMVFLMVFGTLLMQHVPAGWRQGEQRLSGVSLIATYSVLIVTGWMLYYLAGDQVRYWTGKTHAILGLVLPLLIYIHVRQNMKK